ncbi:MAG: hypothetical protein A4E62_02328 [Syntrophorhabdus sp. PtaU1.Bin002]|nr:MAG: hypothetical protein A4E62_02328 [Syntrophorhabdus sp. PtaU1.Bin002]
MNQKLFIYSLFLVAVCFVSALIQMWKLTTHAVIYSDFTLVMIGLLVFVVLLYVSNRHWRLGISFLIGCSLARNLSAIMAEYSVATAVLLSVVSVVLLGPALWCFFKLRAKGPP